MQYKVTRLFHVGWPVGPGTSPGKIIPSLNLCVVHALDKIVTISGIWAYSGPEPGFSEGGAGLEQNVTTARDQKC